MTTETYASFADTGIPTRRNRGTEKTTCPRCSAGRKKKTDPCLSVDHDQGLFNCHHCGWSGRISDNERQPMTPTPYRSPSVPKTYAAPPTLNPSGVDAPADASWQSLRDFFARRSISERTLIENRVSVDLVTLPQTGEPTPVVAFPYYRSGEHVNTKYRALNQKAFRMVAGAEPIWYGLDDCANDDYVVLVEGECDKLACWEAGIKACLSVPNGAPAKTPREGTNAFDFYASGKDIIAAASTVIVATDNDEPGNILAHELGRRAGFDRCRRVFWPPSCKDANDVLTAYGTEKLREVIFNARPWPVEGVIDPSQVFDAVWSLRSAPMYQGVDTGWHNLTQYYKPVPGQLTTVGGTPGSGKSVFLNALLVNIAMRYGWSFAIYSPEYFPVEFHVRDLMSCYVGKSLKDMSMDEAYIANAWVADHFSLICPDADVIPDLDWVMGVVDTLVDDRGIRGFAIDPFTEIDAYRDSGASQTDFINNALTRIRKKCRMKGVHGWVSVHPAKMEVDKDGKPPVVTPYHLAGSAHWFNKSDNILSVQRDKSSDAALVQIHVQKVRFADEGGLGIAQLSYDKFTKRYSNVAE